MSNLDEIEMHSKKAQTLLRKGALPDRVWLSDYSEMALRDFSADTADQPSLLPRLQAIRRAADLFDRIGEYDTARQVLSPHSSWVGDRLAGMLGGPVDKDDEKLLLELLWFSIVFSVCDHRDGNFKRALESLATVRAALDLFPEGEHLELRGRAAYACGRHCQSWAQKGSFEEAERYYEQALSYCLKLSVDHQERDYALYRSGIILTGLARIYLTRGELRRAMRLLSAARIQLALCPDELTQAFATFLMGCAARQTSGCLPESIELLRKALRKFEDLGHQRYYLRCRHELAKALFCQKQYSQAGEVLDFSLMKKFSYVVRRATRDRWQVEDLLLRARISLAANSGSGLRLDDAVRFVEKARLFVTEGVSPTDLKAKLRLVQAEIDMALGQWDVVEQPLHQIVRGELEPLDITEVGWAWVLIAEARIELGLVDGALEAIASFGNLGIRVENAFFAERATAVAEKAKNMAGTLGFWIGLDEENKDIKYYERRLRGWLVGTKLKGKTKSEQATILKVVEKTIENYKKDLAGESIQDHSREPS